MAVILICNRFSVEPVTDLTGNESLPQPRSAGSTA
ncbi:hypothetical protein SAMN05216276_101067 [Streptosporangium subroseum]|uniref:Uncharacterized protein n=1 Tax=Streptosporangium subroseum TaxID=106412 RepID=A0A239ETZ9_9ACTN|nr:hypothetical protein SAMN05216276_101067 [Streptosporangium subroseum]